MQSESPVESKTVQEVTGMTEEQIQDIAMGVVAAAMESQNTVNQMPEMREESMPMEMQPQPEMMPPQGMPQ